MGYTYGAPSDTQLRPRCWGEERFHNMDTRQCRTCTFNMSCRDEIYRLRGWQSAPPPGYQVQPPSSSQVPVHIGPPAAAAPTRNAQPPTSIYPPTERYQYGWLTDPLYYTMCASPPPMRPQLQGENFWERIVKNMVLSAGESMFMHAFLAMRQLVLPPEEPARTQTVDVGQVPPKIGGSNNT